MVSVRVWLKPNELGEAGYSIVFDDARGYEALEDGCLVLYGDPEAESPVGIVNMGRWDACQLLGAEDTAPPG